MLRPDKEAKIVEMLALGATDAKIAATVVCAKWTVHRIRVGIRPPMLSRGIGGVARQSASKRKARPLDSVRIRAKAKRDTPEGIRHAIYVDSLPDESLDLDFSGFANAPDMEARYAEVVARWKLQDSVESKN